jgi:hypothetical protein
MTTVSRTVSRPFRAGVCPEPCPNVSAFVPQQLFPTPAECVPSTHPIGVGTDTVGVEMDAVGASA